MHAYDSFLAAQTRIFTLAHATYNYHSMEIENRQKILLLDDLMIFAIAGRRLVELTKLKSYANGKLVKLAFFDDVSEPKEIYRTTKTIGFLSLLNHLIHADDIYFFHNRLEVTQYFRKIDSVALYRILDKVSRENRWSEYSLEPSVFIVTDRSVPIMCCLSDIAITSIEVAEKIIEQCSDSGIFLESEYRGGV